MTQDSYSSFGEVLTAIATFLEGVDCAMTRYRFMTELQILSSYTVAFTGDPSRGFLSVNDVAEELLRLAQEMKAKQKWTATQNRTFGRLHGELKKHIKRINDTKPASLSVQARRSAASTRRKNTAGLHNAIREVCARLDELLAQRYPSSDNRQRSCLAILPETEVLKKIIDHPHHNPRISRASYVELARAITKNLSGADRNSFPRNTIDLSVFKEDSELSRRIRALAAFIPS